MNIEDLKNVNQLVKNVEAQMPKGRELIYYFTITFARFEFALKQIDRYLKSNPEYGTAEANWIAFSKFVKQRYYLNKNSDAIRPSIDFLLGNPPGVQMVVNRNLEFVHKYDDRGEIGNIICFINVIRNNLLHGNKFDGDYEPDSRNFKLITSALIILDFLLDLDPDVKGHFRSTL